MLADLEEPTLKDLENLKEAVNTEINPIKYLSIDPGKANGICGYDAKYYPQFMLTLRSLDIVRFLHLFEKVDICVIEDFILYPETRGPGKRSTPTYSDMETSRVIGRVEYWAELKGVQVIKQNANVKETGYKWIGKKPLPKSNPRNHSLDAHVHFMYWAIKNNKVNLAEILKRSTK